MSREIARSAGCSVHRRWSPAIAGLLGAVAWLGTVHGGDVGQSRGDERARGRELFEREWLPGDSRAHGGDGLGPVYNDSSCVACHNLGATGGAGPASKNVDIVTASPIGMAPVQQASGGSSPGRPGFLARSLGSLVGLDDPGDAGPGANGARPGGRRRARHRANSSRRIPASGRRGASCSTVSAPAPATRYGGRRSSGSATHLRGSRPKSVSHVPGPERGQLGPFGHADHRRRVRPGALAAQPDAALRHGADRRHPRPRARGSGEGEASRLPGGRRPGQPAEGRADRPVRLEGADALAPGLRPDGLRRRARPGGPRPSPGRSPAEARRQGEGARPHRRGMQRPAGLRPRPAQARGAPAAGRGRCPRDRRGPEALRLGRLRDVPHPEARRGRRDLQRPPAA